MIKVKTDAAPRKRCSRRYEWQGSGALHQGKWLLGIPAGDKLLRNHLYIQECSSLLENYVAENPNVETESMSVQEIMSGHNQNIIKTAQSRFPYDKQCPY